MGPRVRPALLRARAPRVRRRAPRPAAPLPAQPLRSAWAELRVALRDAGRRMPLNDSWIAATALARDVPVVTQDADYDDVPGLDVIHV